MEVAIAGANEERPRVYIHAGKAYDDILAAYRVSTAQRVQLHAAAGETIRNTGSRITAMNVLPDVDIVLARGTSVVSAYLWRGPNAGRFDHLKTIMSPAGYVVLGATSVSPHHVFLRLRHARKGQDGYWLRQDLGLLYSLVDRSATRDELPVQLFRDEWAQPDEEFIDQGGCDVAGHRDGLVAYVQPSDRKVINLHQITATGTSTGKEVFRAPVDVTNLEIFGPVSRGLISKDYLLFARDLSHLCLWRFTVNNQPSAVVKPPPTEETGEARARRLVY